MKYSLDSVSIKIIDMQVISIRSVSIRRVLFKHVCLLPFFKAWGLFGLLHLLPLFKAQPFCKALPFCRASILKLSFCIQAMAHAPQMHAKAKSPGHPCWHHVSWCSIQTRMAKSSHVAYHGLTMVGGDKARVQVGSLRWKMASQMTFVDGVPHEEFVLDCQLAALGKVEHAQVSHLLKLFRSLGRQMHATLFHDGVHGLKILEA